MATAAQKPCQNPGCTSLASGRFCKAHDLPANMYGYDQLRGTAKERGYDSDWRRIRLQALQRDSYLCQHCLPRPVNAVDVHHNVPIAADPSRRLDLSNLVSLCKECHSRITATRNSTFAKAKG